MRYPTQQRCNSTIRAAICKVMPETWVGAFSTTRSLLFSERAEKAASQGSSLFPSPERGGGPAGEVQLISSRVRGFHSGIVC